MPRNVRNAQFFLLFLLTLSPSLIRADFFLFLARARRLRAIGDPNRSEATTTGLKSSGCYRYPLLQRRLNNRKSAPPLLGETTVIYITPGMAFLPYRRPWGKEWPIRSRRETHRFELIMQINRALTFASRLDAYARRAGPCTQGSSLHTLRMVKMRAERINLACTSV